MRSLEEEELPMTGEVVVGLDETDAGVEVDVELEVEVEVEDADGAEGGLEEGGFREALVF